MRSLLFPALLVGLLPLLMLAARFRILRRPLVRRVFAVAAIGGFALALPYQGLSLQEIKLVNGLLALSAAAVLFLCFLKVRWLQSQTRQIVVLGALATLGLLNYLNYFSFHGEKTFVHLHDVAHYYLGSKYYEELGYVDLYTAMLRAESELFNSHFKAVEARDLATYQQVHIQQLLTKSGPVRDRFSQVRWRDFKRDVEWFRSAMGTHYGRVLLDHGFNPTPVWALMGSFLSNLVPAGSSRGILWLTLLDPLLLLGIAGVLVYVLGARISLLASLYFFVLFGTTFGWTGGAFLRFPWLFCVVIGFLLLRKRSYSTSGVLFAVAAAFRVFPVFFVIPLAIKAGYLVYRQGHLPTRFRRFFGAFGITGCLLLALTLLFLPRGLDHWWEFRSNMSNHLENISPNVIGLTEILTFQPNLGLVTADEFLALKNRRQVFYRWQLVLILVPLLFWTAKASVRRRDSEAMLLALPLLFAGLSLAGYYYVFLLLLLLSSRRDNLGLALIFAVEAMSYVLLLFEDREARLFLYRDFHLVFLFLMLLPLMRRAESGLDRACTTS